MPSRRKPSLEDLVAFPNHPGAGCDRTDPRIYLEPERFLSKSKRLPKPDRKPSGPVSRSQKMRLASQISGVTRSWASLRVINRKGAPLLTRIIIVGFMRDRVGNVTAESRY